MSIINQMLKDLEQQPSPHNVPPQAVTLTQTYGVNKMLVVLVTAIIMVTGVAGYLLIQTKAVPVTDMLVQTTAAGSAEQAVQDTLVQAPVPAITSKIVTTEPTPPIQVAEPKQATPVDLVAAVKPGKPKVEIVTAKQTAKKSVQASALPVKPAVTEVALRSASAETENSISIKAITRTRQQQAEFYAQQAEQALLTGDKALAKQHFNQVLQLDNRHDQAREQLAALLYGEQRTKSAVSLLREGLAVSPEYANFRLMLARIFLQNNNKQQAYYYLKPHQPEIAGHVDYYAMLAGLAQNIGDLDTALSAYLKLTAYDPNQAKWWLGLGITADKLQQIELALTAYHKAQTMGQLSAASRNYIDTRITQLEK